MRGIGGPGMQQAMSFYGWWRGRHHPRHPGCQHSPCIVAGEVTDDTRVVVVLRSSDHDARPLRMMARVGDDVMPRCPYGKGQHESQQCNPADPFKPPSAPHRELPHLLRGEHSLPQLPASVKARRSHLRQHGVQRQFRLAHHVLRRVRPVVAIEDFDAQKPPIPDLVLQEAELLHQWDNALTRVDAVTVV